MKNNRCALKVRIVDIPITLDINYYSNPINDRVINIIGRVLSCKTIDNQAKYHLDIEGNIAVYYIKVLTQEIVKTIPN